MAKFQTQQAESVEAFLARGGKIQSVSEDASAKDESLRHCTCGCEGNYTDHSMRLGEKGIY